MFGKTKEIDEQSDDLATHQFFGDEDAAAELADLETLQERVGHVEQQLSSQFTSLAAYAQIAQEQIEIARSEAKHATERTERRVIELIERERADRVEAIESAPTGVPTVQPAGGWTAPGADDRLDALERSVAQIQHGLNECLTRQKALADAITALFDPQVAERTRGLASVDDGDEAALLAPATQSETIGELSIL